MSYKGKYRIENAEKYLGDATKCIYRSLWERDLMRKFDRSSAVLEWASEETVIPYVSPIDGRRHRYFVDFYVKYKMRDGKIATKLIEVKPRKESIQPKKRNQKNRKYLMEVRKWGINSAKWEAASLFCEARGWAFQVMTEYDIYGPTGKKQKGI